MVERFDGKEVHAVLWNRSLLKLGRKEIVWDESNARWETDANGHLIGLDARLQKVDS